MNENISNETNTLTPEESIYSRIDAETKKIDDTINGVASDENSDAIGLRQEVEELEAKLADDSNYFVTVTEDERLEMELIDEEIEEIHRLENVLPKNIEACDKGINLLNKEIADISTRLKKHKIAVEKGYFSQLSQEDVDVLESALTDKTTRLDALVERKERIQTRFNGLEDRLTTLFDRKEKLSKILTGHVVDKYKKLLDQNRYYYLKAGLDALENRKSYIEANKGAVYSEYLVKDQNDEIAALKARVAELESEKKNSENKEATVLNTPTNDVEIDTEDVILNSNAQKLVDAYLNDNDDLKVEESTITTGLENDDTELQDEEKIDRGPTDMIVAPPTGMTVVDKESDPFIDVYSSSKALDNEREAEIEDAEEILKEKKKDGFFKRHWKKFVAAGIVVLAPFLIKGCRDMSQVVPVAPEDTVSKDSYSSTDEGITEENDNKFDEKFEIPSEEEIKNPIINNTVQNEKPSTNITEEKTDSVIEENKPSTTIPGDDSTIPSNPSVTPEEKPEITTQTGVIELSPGEKVIGLGSEGNLETLEHGDMVGTEVEFEGDNQTIKAKLEDYTQDGSAKVNYEKATSDSNSSSKTEQQQVIENILGTYGEENNIGMFDPELFDENGNWIGDLSKGRGK